jgi:tetratricopeptide (TPR) repeat protein
MVKFLIALLFSVSLFAQSVAERRGAIIAIVDEEIAEVRRLSKQVKDNDPNLMLREAELNLEKARLIRENENAKYLAIPAARRRKLKKSSYFKQSRTYFKRAQNICERLLRRFKRFSQKGDVYYIMAYNSKELSKPKNAQKYFNLAIKNSSGRSQTHVKSQIALAEIYFNKRKYRKAIPLYEKSLRKVDDRWWTKDSFNLAWCYYRTKRYGKAINLMNQIYRKSSDPKYENMQGPVVRDIGLFYAYSGRTQEGIDFYARLGKSFTNELIRIAVQLKESSKFTQAKKVLTEAIKFEKTPGGKTIIQSELLELYVRFGKTQSALTTARSLAKSQINAEQRERLVFHVQKQGAKLQKQVIGKRYRGAKKARSSRAKQAVAFFELQYDLMPQRRPETRFLQGETYYAIGYFESALKYYEKSYTESTQAGNSKFKKLSLEALLLTLGKKGLKSSVKNKYYVTVYKNYLETDKRSKRARSIYQKLFNTYFDRKQMNEAEGTLAGYKGSFPQDYKIQEAMIAKLMDYYRKNRKYDKVVYWINNVKNGTYKTTPKYRNKVKDLLTNMQMKDVESALAKGSKTYALKGYLRVYADTSSTPKARKNSAFNIAVLYFELGDAQESYNWSLKALELMKPKDVRKFGDSYLTLTSFLFNRRQFLASADLSVRALGKLCRVKTKTKDVFFKNAVFIYLAENSIAKVEETLATGRRCNISNRYLNEARVEILRDFGSKGRWETFENVLNKLDTYKSIRAQLIPFNHQLMQMYQTIGNEPGANALKKKSLRYYYDAKKAKRKIPLESLDIVSDYLFEDVNKDLVEIKNIRLEFPESNYNSLLKRKFALLDKVTNSALRVQETGSGKGIVRAFYIVAKAHRELGEEIKAFTPPGKSKEYVTSFKRSMRNLVTPILKQADDYERDALRQVNKNDILSKDTFLFLNSKIPVRFNYSYSRVSNLMDRGGKR